MHETTQSETDVFYVMFPTNSDDEGNSLAQYLTSHGIDAVNGMNNEVSVPMTDPRNMALIYQLKKSWGLFWHHTEAALFSLPVYIKDDSGHTTRTR